MNDNSCEIVQTEEANPEAAGHHSTRQGLRAFGPWITLGITFLVILTVLLANQVIFEYSLHTGSSQIDSKLNVAALGVPAGCLACICILTLITRKRGGVNGYLNIKPVRFRDILTSTGGYFIFFLFSLAFSALMGLETVPPWQAEIFSLLQGWRLPVFMGAVIIAAPLWEEAIFRGFAYRGLSASVIGGGGAIILTSLIWTMLHMQYSLPYLILVFAFGCFLGILRRYYNSLTICLFIHSLNNTIACLVTMYLIPAAHSA